MIKDLTLCQPIITDIKEIILAGRKSAYSAANFTMLLTYWHIGKRIVEQEQEGNERAQYGKKLIRILSEELTQDCGKGFSERNLRNFREFYILFPEKEIWQTCLPNLTWSHVCCLLRDGSITYRTASNARKWRYSQIFAG